MEITAAIRFLSSPQKCITSNIGIMVIILVHKFSAAKGKIYYNYTFELEFTQTCPVSSSTSKSDALCTSSVSCIYSSSWDVSRLFSRSGERKDTLDLHSEERCHAIFSERCPETLNKTEAVHNQNKCGPATSKIVFLLMRLMLLWYQY